MWPEGLNPMALSGTETATFRPLAQYVSSHLRHRTPLLRHTSATIQFCVRCTVLVEGCCIQTSKRNCRWTQHPISRTIGMCQRFQNCVSRHTDVLREVARCVATTHDAIHWLNTKYRLLLSGITSNLKLAYGGRQSSVCRVQSKHRMVPEETWHESNTIFIILHQAYFFRVYLHLIMFTSLKLFVIL